MASKHEKRGENIAPYQTGITSLFFIKQLSKDHFRRAEFGKG